MIDASIAMGVRPVQLESPVNQLAKILQIQGLQQDQQLGRMKMDEYQRDSQRRNRMDEILAAGGGAQELRRGGFLKESLDFEKNAAEIAHKGSETGKNKTETAVKKVTLYRDAVNGVNDPDSVRAYIQAMHADPDLKGTAITAVPVENLLAQVPADPVQFADFKRKFVLGAEKFMADERQRQQIAETGRHNKATEDLTVRGQDKADARARAAQEQAERHFQAGQNAPRGQFLETPNGYVLGDPKTGDVRPVMGPDGQQLPGKPSASMEKELTSLRQQGSIVDGALAAVDKTPSAFSMGRGVATMGGAIAESVAGRYDSDAERQARAYVFNNVSKVINERAGAAQSAQELARLRSFLPADTDNADQIKSKLQAFKVYLGDMERGTRGTPPTSPRQPGGYSDAAKEQRYQEWKRKQGVQ